MHTHHSRPPDIHGSALLASLIIIGVLSMILASYLSMSQRQTVSVARSQAWNAAIPVAEGGVEEALAQLNRGVGAGALNLAVNGWQQNAGGSYGPQQRRYLGSNYYDVVIVPGATPVIYSTGYTAAPFGSSRISRAVQVNTSSNAPLFAVVMGARQKVDFNGFEAATDSFDSDNASYNT